MESGGGLMKGPFIRPTCSLSAVVSLLKRQLFLRRSECVCVCVRRDSFVPCVCVQPCDSQALRRCGVLQPCVSPLVASMALCLDLKSSAEKSKHPGALKANGGPVVLQHQDHLS